MVGSSSARRCLKFRLTYKAATDVYHDFANSIEATYLFKRIRQALS